MARPKANQPPDGFTTTECAVACGLSPREWEFLVKRHYAPDPPRHTSGRNSATIYDQTGLRHAALIGVFRNDGLPLLVAAQLAKEIKKELGARYYTVPS